jgi:AraC-like DNA-binding protein
MSDPLSTAIEELGLRRAVFRRSRARLGSPLRFEGGRQGLHVLERGQATLRVERLRIALRPGDVIIALRGADHELHAVGADADVVCGLFELDAKDHPMLASLPAVLHCRPSEGQRLARHVETLLAELAAPLEGTSAIVARLSEVLLVEGVRSHAGHIDECPSGGWFRGLRDPALGRALSAFHADPAAGWTVASMARVAGQSRSAFAARFSEVMGETPLAFVTRWRMFHARTLLRTTEASLDEIATRVGYASAAAFSVAFGRAHGRTPGAYRSESR